VRPARSKPNIGWFDIDDVGIARAQLAQLMSYWFSVAFVVEQLLTLLIGRPSAVAPVVPAGDILVGSSAQRDAIRHCATPFDFSKGARSHLRNFSTLGDPNGCFRLVEQLRVGAIGAGEALANC
jgi:hypothetical protein